MICAACAGTIPATDGACSLCGAPAVLRGGDGDEHAYRLEALLGQGASGTTYRAIRRSDGRALCVKELQYRRMGSFEVEKLFDREARVLRELDHPQIPAYVDDFTAGTGKALALYLVQELVDGESLAAEMDARRYREDEVLEILDELASILAYLHDLRPPVVHRDLKPGNVMRRRADGRLVLVDFGSVKDAVRDPGVGGSTVAGTIGFMPPEQLYGQAQPASDLYALGALAVALLSRRRPDQMIDPATHRLDWRSWVEVTPDTAGLLQGLLAHEVGDRVQTAAQARTLIAGALEAVRGGGTRAPAARPTPKREAAVPVLSPLLSPPPSPSPSSSSSPEAVGRSWKVLAVASIAVVLAVGLVVVVAAPDDPRAGAASTCPGGVCQPVPRGLKGLTFGMSVEEAKSALPELAITGRPVEPDLVWGGGGLLAMDFARTRKLPGPQWELRTTLGSEPATCALAFSASERLSRMECQIDPLGSIEAHVAVETAMLADLRATYGFEHSGPSSDYAVMPMRAGTWVWSDEEARLVLTTHVNVIGGSDPTSRLTLANLGRAHEKVISDLEREIDAEHAADEKRKTDEAAAARRAELERLKGGGKSLKDDLGGAPAPAAPSLP